MNDLSGRDATRAYPAAAVEAFCLDVLRAAGVDPEPAQAVAGGLCAASLRGIDSHGVFLLPHYVRGVLGGRINPRPVARLRKGGASVAVLDADHGFGHWAGREAMRRAVELAGASGAAWVGVANSSHCGAMGPFAELACPHDMIGVAMTHATARMRSHNGVSAFLGANPLAVAMPMRDEEPFCFDAGMTTSTFNAIRLAKLVGRELAPGLAADRAGEPTTDPAAAAQLLPIGDHKGFGLAMVVDVFCALLTGMPAGPDVSSMFEGSFAEPRRLGHMFGAVRIRAFVDPSVFRARLQEMAGSVRRQPARGAEPVQMPGDPEKAERALRLARGLPLPAELVAQFDEIAGSLSVAPLASR